MLPCVCCGDGLMAPWAPARCPPAYVSPPSSTFIICTTQRACARRDARSPGPYLRASAHSVSAICARSTATLASPSLTSPRAASETLPARPPIARSLISLPNPARFGSLPLSPRLHRAAYLAPDSAARQRPSDPAPSALRTP